MAPRRARCQAETRQISRAAAIIATLGFRRRPWCRRSGIGVGELVSNIAARAATKVVGANMLTPEVSTNADFSLKARESPGARSRRTLVAPEAQGVPTSSSITTTSPCSCATSAAVCREDRVESLRMWRARALCGEPVHCVESLRIAWRARASRGEPVHRMESPHIARRSRWRTRRRSRAREIFGRSVVQRARQFQGRAPCGRQASSSARL